MGRLDRFQQHRSAFAILVGATLIAACGQAMPSPSSSARPGGPSPSTSATTPMELPTGSEPLPAGLYTRAAFQPRLTFELANGWFVGSLADGFFDVQQQQGTPDAIAVQFGLVQRVIGAGSATVPSTKAEAAARTIHDNPGLVVVAESASRLGGLEGFTVEVDNQRDSTSPVLEVPAGMLAIDPDRRLWISLFDTGDGVLAVIVEGSVSGWERALAVAEPVLESIVIGEPLGAVRPRTRARIIHA